MCVKHYKYINECYEYWTVELGRRMLDLSCVIVNNVCI